MRWKPEAADMVISGVLLARPVPYEFARLESQPDCGQPRCEQNYFYLVIGLGSRYITTFHMGLN